MARKRPINTVSLFEGCPPGFNPSLWSRPIKGGSRQGNKKQTAASKDESDDYIEQLQSSEAPLSSEEKVGVKAGLRIIKSLGLKVVQVERTPCPARQSETSSVPHEHSNSKNNDKTTLNAIPNKTKWRKRRARRSTVTNQNSLKTKQRREFIDHTRNLKAHTAIAVQETNEEVVSNFSRKCELKEIHDSNYIFNSSETKSKPHSLSKRRKIHSRFSNLSTVSEASAAASSKSDQSIEFATKSEQNTGCSRNWNKHISLSMEEGFGKADHHMTVRHSESTGMKPKNQKPTDIATGLSKPKTDTTATKKLRPKAARAIREPKSTQMKLRSVNAVHLPKYIGNKSDQSNCNGSHNQVEAVIKNCETHSMFEAANHCLLHAKKMRRNMTNTKLHRLFQQQNSEKKDKYSVEQRALNLTNNRDVQQRCNNLQDETHQDMKMTNLETITNGWMHATKDNKHKTKKQCKRLKDKSDLPPLVTEKINDLTSIQKHMTEEIQKRAYMQYKHSRQETQKSNHDNKATYDRNQHEIESRHDRPTSPVVTKIHDSHNNASDQQCNSTRSQGKITLTSSAEDMIIALLNYNTQNRMDNAMHTHSKVKSQPPETMCKGSRQEYQAKTTSNQTQNYSNGVSKNIPRTPNRNVGISITNHKEPITRQWAFNPSSEAKVAKHPFHIANRTLTTSKPDPHGEPPELPESPALSGLLDGNQPELSTESLGDGYSEWTNQSLQTPTEYTLHRVCERLILSSETSDQSESDYITSSQEDDLSNGRCSPATIVNNETTPSNVYHCYHAMVPFPSRLPQFPQICNSKTSSDLVKKAQINPATVAKEYSVYATSMDESSGYADKVNNENTSDPTGDNAEDSQQTASSVPIKPSAFAIACQTELPMHLVAHSSCSRATSPLALPMLHTSAFLTRATSPIVHIQPTTAITSTTTQNISSRKQEEAIHTTSVSLPNHTVRGTESCSEPLEMQVTLANGNHTLSTSHINLASADLSNQCTQILQSTEKIVNRAKEAWDTLDNINDIMERELQCSICKELFISAMSISCAHTFCTMCIQKWRYDMQKHYCPICRARIRSQVKALALDSYITQLTQKIFHEDQRKRRAEMIAERENETIRLAGREQEYRAMRRTMRRNNRSLRRAHNNTTSNAWPERIRETGMRIWNTARRLWRMRIVDFIRGITDETLEPDDDWIEDGTSPPDNMQDDDIEILSIRLQEPEEQQALPVRVIFGRQLQLNEQSAIETGPPVFRNLLDFPAISIDDAVTDGEDTSPTPVNEQPEINNSQDSQDGSDENARSTVEAATSHALMSILPIMPSILRQLIPDQLQNNDNIQLPSPFQVILRDALAENSAATAVVGNHPLGRYIFPLGEQALGPFWQRRQMRPVAATDGSEESLADRAVPDLQNTVVPSDETRINANSRRNSNNNDTNNASTESNDLASLNSQ